MANGSNGTGNGAKTGVIEHQSVPYWVPDTRTVIVCWLMVSSFMIILILCFVKPPDSQLVNTLLGIYIGSGFTTGVNWWMGAAKGTDSDNRMKEKISDAVTPNGPGGAAVPLAVVMAWWGVLKKEEQDAIEAAAKTDPRINAFVIASKNGKATPEDLAYLVSKNLLTAPRAKEVEAS